MINLYQYITEGIFDIDNNIENIDKQIKEDIKNFLKTNYKGRYQISSKPNKDGKYEISSLSDIEVKNHRIKTLTNGAFIWTNVDGKFTCSMCDIISLEGAPIKVGRNFSCLCCGSLKSLKGAPKEVGRGFDCSFCRSLTSLEGSPEKVGIDFKCESCNSLKSLEGAPKEVGRRFVCRACAGEFTEDDVKAVCNVKEKICI